MDRTITRLAPVKVQNAIRGEYLSSSAVERFWSDGTSDYICSAVRCDFTAEGKNALRSLATHFTAHHDRETERHFPDVPWPHGPQYRRPNNKVTVTANTASNGEVVNAIRRLVALTGKSDPDVQEYQELLAEAERERDLALQERDAALNQSQPLVRDALQQRDEALGAMGEALADREALALVLRTTQAKASEAEEGRAQAERSLRFCKAQRSELHAELNELRAWSDSLRSLMKNGNTPTRKGTA